MSHYACFGPDGHCVRLEAFRLLETAQLNIRKVSAKTCNTKFVYPKNRVKLV